MNLTFQPTALLHKRYTPKNYPRQGCCYNLLQLVSYVFPRRLQTNVVKCLICIIIKLAIRPGKVTTWGSPPKLGLALLTATAFVFTQLPLLKPSSIGCCYPSSLLSRGYPTGAVTPPAPQPPRAGVSARGRGGSPSH